MDGMRALFNPHEPYFPAWIEQYDIDTESAGRLSSETPSPLYYSALCGFHELVRRLAIQYPSHVNAIGGSWGFPLVAALRRNHVRVAELLLEYGASVNVRDARYQTALHKTLDHPDKVSIDAVLLLLERGVDVNARSDDLLTPLHIAVNVGDLVVARALLDHGADVNARNEDGQTPLHLLSRREMVQGEGDGSDLARLLLEHGANANEIDNDNATPLHLASYYKKLGIVQLLLDHGAKPEAETDIGETPLYLALCSEYDPKEDEVTTKAKGKRSPQWNRRSCYNP